MSHDLRRELIARLEQIAGEEARQVFGPSADAIFARLADECLVQVEWALESAAEDEETLAPEGWPETA